MRNITMTKDALGIAFYADGCGDRRFHTRHDAELAYRAYAQVRDAEEDRKRASHPNRAEYREAVGVLVIYESGRMTRKIAAMSRESARRVFNRECSEDSQLIFV